MDLLPQKEKLDFNQSQLEKVILKIIVDCGKTPEESHEFLKKEKIHIDLLLNWNKTHNLTSFNCQEEIYAFLLLDSLLVLEAVKKKVISFKPQISVADLGSGNGFPGIPLALLFPNTCFTLIEANKKKGAFLKFSVAQMNLENVDVFLGRSEKIAEMIKSNKLPPFDIVLSKASASLADVLDYAWPLLRDGGQLIVWGTTKTKTLLDKIERYNWKISTFEPSITGVKRFKLNTVLLLFKKISLERF